LRTLTFTVPRPIYEMVVNVAAERKMTIPMLLRSFTAVSVNMPNLPEEVTAKPTQPKRGAILVRPALKPKPKPKLVPFIKPAKPAVPFGLETYNEGGTPFDRNDPVRRRTAEILDEAFGPTPPWDDDKK
jgi:hypothetical protein